MFSSKVVPFSDPFDDNAFGDDFMIDGEKKTSGTEGKSNEADENETKEQVIVVVDEETLKAETLEEVAGEGMDPELKQLVTGLANSRAKYRKKYKETEEKLGKERKRLNKKVRHLKMNLEAAEESARKYFFQ